MGSRLRPGSSGLLFRPRSAQGLLTGGPSRKKFSTFPGTEARLGASYIHSLEVKETSIHSKIVGGSRLYPHLNSLFQRAVDTTARADSPARDDFLVVILFFRNGKIPDK
jgi:hypothetical protein